jgi:redox-sensitive bicupin YhaK (pirin superfamily)
MSDLIVVTQISDSKDCPASSLKPVHQKLPTHKAIIGDNITIRRALPHRERRMIGAWCFFDHFGPLNLKNSDGIKIGPHPHMGLQTFTWTIAGEILHRDSLGSLQIIQPGQVNLMTAGHAISHSEESLPDTILHGVQLWIALPEAERFREPDFVHYSQMPTLDHDGLLITLLAGELFGKQAPTKVYSPLMGSDINAAQDVTTSLPLNPTFEYGILPLIGSIDVENETIDIDTLLYLGCGRSQVSIRTKQGTRFLMIGGEPFKEEILIWWNFVARTNEEIIEAIHDWNNQTRFGEVKGYPGDRLTAPEMPSKLN